VCPCTAFSSLCCPWSRAQFRPAELTALAETNTGGPLFVMYYEPACAHCFKANRVFEQGAGFFRGFARFAKVRSPSSRALAFSGHATTIATAAIAMLWFSATSPTCATASSFLQFQLPLGARHYNCFGCCHCYCCRYCFGCCHCYCCCCCFGCCHCYCCRNWFGCYLCCCDMFLFLPALLLVFLQLMSLLMLLSWCAG
jgi:hypothetical protein